MCPDDNMKGKNTMAEEKKALDTAKGAAKKTGGLIKEFKEFKALKVAQTQMKATAQTII